MATIRWTVDSDVLGSRRSGCRRSLKLDRLHRAVQFEFEFEFDIRTRTAEHKRCNWDMQIDMG